MGCPRCVPLPEKPPVPALLPTYSQLTIAFPPSPPSTLSSPAPSTRSTASVTTSPSSEDDFDLGLPKLVSPDNFAQFAKGLYRSSFPHKKHFAFLRSLGLKSVVTLVSDEYPEENVAFMHEEGITFFQLGIPGNKEPKFNILHEKIPAALRIILDKRNHPLLVHCNKGKHRTGTLVGCLRRLQHWSVPDCLDEYSLHAHPKERLHDQNFITNFDIESAWKEVDCSQLPAWCPASLKDGPLLPLPKAIASLVPADDGASTPLAIATATFKTQENVRIDGLAIYDEHCISEKKAEIDGTQESQQRCID